MIGIDTNILARYLLNDDRAQAKAAARVLAAGAFTLPPTVLLELVWVLEVNDCTREEIFKGVRHILGLPSIQLMELEAVTYAVRWYEAGLDFGDALHLALSAKKCDGFATFDKALAKQVVKAGIHLPVSLMAR